MKIIMSETVDGSIDGIRVATFFAGTEHDLSGTPGERALAAAFVGAGMAADVSTGADAVRAPATQAEAPAAQDAAPTKRPYNRKAK